MFRKRLIKQFEYLIVLTNAIYVCITGTIRSKSIYILARSFQIKWNWLASCIIVLLLNNDYNLVCFIRPGDSKQSIKTKSEWHSFLVNYFFFKKYGIRYDFRKAKRNYKNTQNCWNKRQPLTRNQTRNRQMQIW